MRGAAAIVLLIGAGAAAWVREESWAAGLAAVGVAAHLITAPDWRRGLPALVPALLFAAALAALGQFGGAGGLLPALKTVAVFAFVVAAARLAPVEPWLGRAGPGSRWFRGALFLLMVRHFAAIFGQETWRMLVAHRLAAPRRWRREWFDSLAWAMAALLRRALLRAERFYAAQRVRGLGE